MTARRDAALRLQQVLVDDVAGYECGIEGVRAGLVLELMVPQVGCGAAHRERGGVRNSRRPGTVSVWPWWPWRLDNGMSPAEIGRPSPLEAACQSLPGEAREEWPELADGHPERSVVVTAEG